MRTMLAVMYRLLGQEGGLSVVGLRAGTIRVSRVGWIIRKIIITIALGKANRKDTETGG
jgi:hypothetical protein